MLLAFLGFEGRPLFNSTTQFGCEGSILQAGNASAYGMKTIMPWLMVRSFAAAADAKVSIVVGAEKRVPLAWRIGDQGSKADLVVS